MYNLILISVIPTCIFVFNETHYSVLDIFETLLTLFNQRVDLENMQRVKVQYKKLL